MDLWDVIDTKGKEGVAFIHLLRSRVEKDVLIECVESLDPPKPPEEKWVITLSSQKGCPAKCVFCDASFYFKGSLTKEELKSQLDVILEKHKDDNYLRAKKIKIHFARMGEPAFNDSILEFLPELKTMHQEAAFIPTIATLGPANRWRWFEELKKIKDAYFSGGRFQLQFSMNTTDDDFRNKIMPVKKASFKEISAFGEKWISNGDRKVTLNYALFEEAPFEAEKIISLFSPEHFLVKLTPLNPTVSAVSLKIKSDIGFDLSVSEKVKAGRRKLENAGFDVILSIGSPEEIKTGSNCGQLAFAHLLKERENLEMAL
jgi:23S rRNA (adenine2503-C2)-methyltransferase